MPNNRRACYHRAWKKIIDKKLGAIQSPLDFEIEDIIDEIVPVRNESDPFWEQGAHETLRAVINFILNSKNSKTVSVAKIRDIIGVVAMRLDELK